MVTGKELFANFHVLKVSFPLMHALGTDSCKLMIKAQSSYLIITFSIHGIDIYVPESVENSSKGVLWRFIVDDFPILGGYQQKLTKNSTGWEQSSQE